MDKIQQGQKQSPASGKEDPRQQYSLVKDHLGSYFVEKAFGTHREERDEY